MPYASFTIHLKPYLAKYLRFYSRFSSEEKRKKADPDHLYFDQKNPMGKFIIAMLSAEHEIDGRGKRRGIEVVICIPEKHHTDFDTRGENVCLSKKSADIVEDMLSSLFVQQLYFFTETKKQNRQKVQDSILEYLRIFSITEDDLTFEAAKKQLFRYKKMLALPEL